MIRRIVPFVTCLFSVITICDVVTSFSTIVSTAKRRKIPRLHPSGSTKATTTTTATTNLFSSKETMTSTSKATCNKNIHLQLPNVVLSLSLYASLMLFCGPQASFGSEIGVEVEAPTFITGETVEICTKRGILGACLQTEMRTERNDNDIAKRYYKQIDKSQSNRFDDNDDQGNALIQKLRQQSVDNAERNNLLVQRKTFENDQAAVFGPFDRQVLIMNTDSKTFTLLQNPQAMRLKRDGYINERRQFIKQPTPEELEKALTSDGDGLFSGLFGN